MVNPSAQSLLAEYALADDFDIELDATRGFSPKREQPSRARFATEARYSRRRPANSNAPRGPRRRFHKPNGL